MDDIFISYSHEDQIFANDLAKLLSETYERVWYDKRLNAGQAWEKEILDRVRNCDHFIFLISKDSLDSPWCQLEYIEAEKSHRHIIPILVRGVAIPNHAVQRWQILDMSDGISVQNLNKLYRSLIHSLKSQYKHRQLIAELRDELLNIAPNMAPTDSEETITEVIPEPAFTELPSSDPMVQPQPQPGTKNGSSMLPLDPDISTQIRHILPSFVQALKEWDDEPWNLIFKFTGARQKLLIDLNSKQQRQLYEAVRDLIHAAHEITVAYEYIMQMMVQWSQNSELLSDHDADVDSDDDEFSDAGPYGTPN